MPLDYSAVEEYHVRLVKAGERTQGKMWLPEGQEWQVEGAENVRGVMRYDVVCPAGEQRKSMNETRLGANIQLARPLDRLLASQIESKEWR